MIQKWLYILLVFMLISNIAFAQKTPTKKDSINIYAGIESYSKRNKFNMIVYSLIFKPILPGAPQSSIKKKS